MRTRDLLILAVCAVLAFGGTFTCNWNSDGDDDDHDDKPQPRRTTADAGGAGSDAGGLAPEA